MEIPAIITLVVIFGALVLFATEIVSIDLVAMLIMVSLILTGVITPQQGVDGFSNKATITVAFMFVLSAALLKSGALQQLALKFSDVFRYNFTTGMVFMMVLVAVISAFVNNTPVVAMFIPVVIQIANSSGQSASKMLIPLSFASILGGTCTLIGTSTNILVSGIAEKSGLPPISMFEMSYLGLIFLAVGVLYMVFVGIKLLPATRTSKNLSEKFGMRDYITEIELLSGSDAVGKRIMDASLVSEFELDIIEIARKDSRFNLPQGDFILMANDVLKVRSNIEKIKSLKEKPKILVKSPLEMGDDEVKSANSTLIEMIITADSELDGKTLKEIDFRRKYRAAPLAIKHRDEIKHETLYNVKLRAGDVILAEVKNHYIKELKRLETKKEAPFILLSEDALIDYNPRKFFISMAVVISIIILASIDVLDIMVGSIAGVIALVLLRVINMKETYEAINWNVIFLLAGALSLGTAMSNTGLDIFIAHSLVDQLGQWGPIALLSGLYLVTALLTELMSNNATAALMTPIAIATAAQLGVPPMPFLMAIMFAASASFATPIGYQTNTMVYSAGQYKFKDFIKVGAILNILFWIIASLIIPLFYGMY